MTQRQLQYLIVSIAVVFALLAARGFAASDDPYVQTRQGNVPKPIVAVDNACAWPNLTVLRDGTIIATIFNAPYHANIVGDVECWASVDGGKTWEHRGTPARHDPPNSNRMNVAAGLAKNGDLIVISSGWLLQLKPPPPPGQLRTAGLVSVLQPWVCRSTDGGRTWTVDKHAMSAKGLVGGPPVPFGDIIEGRDGALRVAAYTRVPSENKSLRLRRAYVYRSQDDGRTWGEPAPIDDDQSRCEPALLHLGGGKWLVITRGGGQNLYSSVDDATTWRHRTRLHLGGYPCHLMRLRSGRLILSVGTRSGLARHTRVFYSDDEGKTWSRPYRVVDYKGKDGGYPSSIELPDGQVLTAYYAKEIAGHPRYHMGVVIWEPERSFSQ